MNSRQSFYSITFLKEFKQMGRRKLYMIHTMTDETYAVNCTLDLPKKEKEDTMFLVALFSRYYWIVGSVLGGILGQIIPFDLTGLDFCMTALFLITLLTNGKSREAHAVAVSALITFGLRALPFLAFPAAVKCPHHSNDSAGHCRLPSWRY